MPQTSFWQRRPRASLCAHPQQLLPRCRRFPPWTRPRFRPRRPRQDHSGCQHLRPLNCPHSMSSPSLTFSPVSLDTARPSLARWTSAMLKTRGRCRQTALASAAVVRAARPLLLGLRRGAGPITLRTANRCVHFDQTARMNQVPTSL